MSNFEYSNFPESLDYPNDNTAYLSDLTANDWKKVKQYNEAVQNGDDKAASAILKELEGKNITAKDINKIIDCIRAIETAYFNNTAKYKVVSNGDFNNMTTVGLYTMKEAAANKPTAAGYYSLIVLKSDVSNDNCIHQIAILEQSSNVYVRYLFDNWSPWVKINDGGNADTVDGKHASDLQNYNNLINKPNSLKNPNPLILQFNGTTQKNYDGSSSQTLNITPSGIGAANINHAPASCGTVGYELISNRNSNSPIWKPPSYALCSTDSSVSAKTVSVINFKLITGARVLVKFNNQNTATVPTLNVSNTGAKAIRYGDTIFNTSTTSLLKGHVYEFVYDGTYYQLVGDIGDGHKKLISYENGIYTSSEQEEQSFKAGRFEDMGWGAVLTGYSDDENLYERIFMGENSRDKCYLISKGVSERRSLVSGTCATIIIAANNTTPEWVKYSADYICSGTNDNITIQNAVNSLPNTGGKIILLNGNYKISAQININKPNVSIEGMGNSTEISVSAESKINIFSVSKRKFCLSKVYITNSSYSYNVIGSTEQSYSVIIEDIEVNDNKLDYMCNINYLNNSRISNCYISGSNAGLIRVNTSGSNTIINNCYCYNINSNCCISLKNCSYFRITNNYLTSNYSDSSQESISINGGNYNLIIGCILYGGIYSTNITTLQKTGNFEL